MTRAPAVLRRIHVRQHARETAVGHMHSLITFPCSALRRDGEPGGWVLLCNWPSGRERIRGIELEAGEFLGGELHRSDVC